ncbi:MAG: polyphosphate kinase 1, partial [Acidimicrobiia bacterium]|nr:polyphosphate kinase 1 [Acidimicrobiia bacterium]
MATAEPAPGGESIDLRAAPERLLNRELSWLDFNRRVLAQAEDVSIPILERVKFLAIHASNLDEFFQVRVAGLKDQVAARVSTTTPDGRTPSEQLDSIHRDIDAQLAVVAETLHGQLLPALASVGVVLVGWDDLDDDDRRWAATLFEERVFPVLTPLAVDLGRPFPFISNLSLSLGVILSGVDSDQRLFARIKVPPLLDRFVALPDGRRFLPLEQLIIAHLEQLFPGMTIVDNVVFRVTRNADLAIDEGEADDLLEAVEVELRRRRFRSVVRLEVERPPTDEARRLLLDELEIDEDDMYVTSVLLDLASLWQLHGLDRPDLKEPAWKSIPPPEFRDLDGTRDIFSVLRERDVLVHHPYTSFSGSVQEFIRQASRDPAVLAIKLTLYRTSGDSPIVESLIHAAEAGKQVAVVVELKARFDEENNIEWARRLERAGVHVAHGFAGIKVHTKTALVVREEADGIRRYGHVGTGNYNSKTARLYEDFGLLTADERIGADLTQLFNFLTGYGRDVGYERLLVAPHQLRGPLAELIANEAELGPAGRIVMKMNSLVDADLIDELYEASSRGVRIDLIVRGICCLRPEVPGLSDTIRVRSLVGRYLEHSRVFYFANGEGPGRPSYLIGSADLMPRNLDRRVEALAFVDAPALRERLDIVIDTCLSDAALAWCLDRDGQWRRASGPGRSTHDVLRELEAERAEAAETVLREFEAERAEAAETVLRELEAERAEAAETVVREPGAGRAEAAETVVREPGAGRAEAAKTVVREL